jgi:general stress protein YciG
LPIVWNIREPQNAGKNPLKVTLQKTSAWHGTGKPLSPLCSSDQGEGCLFAAGRICQKRNVIMRNDGQKSNRGFASMDQAKQREIASKGGQSVPPEKRSFSQDPNLAATAGKKGGESVPPQVRSFSQNRELAAEAGRKGGLARGTSMRENNREGGKAGTYETPEVEHEEAIPPATGNGAVPSHKQGSHPPARA